MLGFPLATQLFSSDQQWSISGNLYDTPFTPLEGFRTNEIWNSRQIGGAGWGNNGNGIAFTLNEFADPSGNMVATGLRQSAVAGPAQRDMRQTITAIPSLPGKTVTISGYARLVSGTDVGIKLFLFEQGGAGTVLPTMAVTSQWQRFSFTRTVSAGTTGLIAGVFVNWSQTGGASDAVYAVCDWQLELGAMTSFIPTPIGASASRSVESGGTPSAGIIFDVVEPTDGTQKTWKTFCDSFIAQAQNASAATAFTTNATNTRQINSGRTDNVVGYWAGGSPGHHGATVPGRVGYHYKAYLRSDQGRAYFSTATTPSWFLAIAGNGYVRIDKTVGGVVTTIFSGAVSEKDFLITGYQLTATIADMVAGSSLDIYYLQTGSENWGGFVVKAVPAARGSADDQAAAASAQLLGCGLCDDNVPPAAQALSSIKSIEVDAARGRPTQATLVLPLVNANTFDGTGWKWIRGATPDDPGTLQCWNGGSLTATVNRKRLVQILLGFAGEPYTSFTGFVEDYSQPENGQVTLTLRNFESRLIDQHDKNYPDPISYMTRGYRQTTSVTTSTEPIYAIPAYDNWPIEYVLADLMLRNGIDASRLIEPLAVPQTAGVTVPVVNGTDTFLKFRARTLGGKLLRLERGVHYGNGGIGFDETLPADDTYIFKPEITKEIWNRCREVVERIGYDLRFDEFGDCCLRPRNNPHWVVDWTAAQVVSGTPLTKTHPSAYGAKYLEFSGAFSVAVTGSMARVDAVMPIGPTLGAVTYEVRSGSSTGAIVASGTITPTAATDAFFYDGILTDDASNATVVTLYSGDFATYYVKLSASTAGTRRVDSLLVYHTDPMLPKLPQSLSTSRNALRVQAQSAMEEMRNSVIVVGRRKAALTDSAKLATNPNNPDGEFVVERVVDKRSITDPTATNYIGAVKESIIFDSSITDNAYAKYVARVFVYRYRNPRPPVSAEHTLLPVIQLTDPVYAEEARHQSVGINVTDPRKSVLWVTGYKHKIEGKRALTSVTTQAFPDFPAFEPREDIDLAAFGGKPVINMAIQYTSLTGEVKTNPAPGLPVVCKEIQNNGSNFGELCTIAAVAVTGTNTLQLPSTANWPPVPGTVFIRPNFASPGFGAVTTPTLQADFMPIRRGMVLPTVKLPYQVGVTSVTIDYKFEPDKVALPTRYAEWYYELSDDDVISVGGGEYHNDVVDEVKANVSWKQGTKDTRLGWVTNNPYHHFFNVDSRDASRKLTLVWNQGDNAQAAYQRAAADSYDIRYRRLGPVDGSFNFLDPYTGTSPFYDPYSSELGYQVQISADFLVSGLYRVSVRNVDDGTIVAWLTEPGADATKPESHYQYFAAGAARQFAWDGVDQIGDWNSRQSVEYAALANGAFEEKQRVIGAGFYVWNREFADRLPGPLAIIAGTRDTNTGEPVFGHGTFAQWYVMIECKADNVNTSVRSDKLDSTNNGGVAAALIYTHLPEPTKAEVAVVDWISGTDYSATDSNPASAASAQNPANWGLPSAEATVNNQKPVRMRFKVAQRPGTLWTGQQGNTTVKLNRLVHLRATIMDQFVTFNGSNWPNTAYEDRAVVNRRLVNDQHTNKYEDDNYRKASSLKWVDADPGTEWIFTPANFLRNFRGIPNEPIAFGDYLQLEELPKWDEGQRTVVGGNRARMQLAFMSYLWYLSGFVTDRSGRSVWAVNRKFVDKAKICNNLPREWPDLSQPAGTNSALWSDDITNAVWTGTAGVARNAVGLDGVVNTATTLTDNSAVAFFVRNQQVTVANDSATHAVAVWVQKDAITTRYPQFKLVLSGGTTGVTAAASLSTATGATAVAGGTPTITVVDTMGWWVIRFAITNNSTGNTALQIQLFPAAKTGLATVDDVAAQGSIVVGQVNLSLNTSSSTAAPIYTTTTAVTTAVPGSCTVGTETTRYADMPDRQHRRTLVTRQWADEKVAGTSWRTAQATKWGFSQLTTDLGWNLLRHKWSDHDITSTTLNGNAWSGYTGMTTDTYTHWHAAFAGTKNADNPTLPSTYLSMARQFNATQLGSLWTWETGPKWVPCITRDFHGYYMLPPMIDRYTVTRATPLANFPLFKLPNGSSTIQGYDGFAFMQVDMREYRNETNQNDGNDAAAGETWTSPVWDMTQAADATATSVVRFWPGHRVSTQEEPTKSKGVQSNTVDYVRQDELVHWEDLRGMYSRGKRPTEQPIKVSPVQPYYMNVFRYEPIIQDTSFHNGSYPLFRGKISNWFAMTFRSEYFWESGAFFPVDARGAEKLDAMNAAEARFLDGTALSKVRYDHGAYVGWKDDWDATDQSNATTNYTVGKVGFRTFESFQSGGGRSLTPFEAATQVVGVGPRLAQTTDMLFHLVLVTERRSAAV